MIYRQPRKRKTNNFGKVLFWGGVGGLIIKHNWTKIDKWLSEPIPAPQQAYPQVQPVSPQMELPPLPPFEFSEEGKKRFFELLRNMGQSELVPTSSELMEYPDPADAALARMVDHPSVVLAIGRKGGGKTAVILRIQELMRDVAPPYAIGLPEKASRLLPEWYGLADDLEDIPENATVYFPESYRTYHARSTQSQQGRSLSDLVNLSRHRRHTLFFDVQNTAQLDRNILSEVDLILVKQPGLFHLGFERSQLRPVVEAARVAFAGVGRQRKKKVVWVWGDSAGQLMENALPSFWSDKLSRIFGDAGPALKSDATESSGSIVPSGAKPRRAQTTPTAVKKAKVLKLSQAGHSLSEIAKLVGISKSYVYKLLKQP